MYKKVLFVLAATVLVCLCISQLAYADQSVDSEIHAEKRQANRVKPAGKQAVIAPPKQELKKIKGRVVNKAEFYSDQYPAIFNIIFWTSLILGIAVFSIAYNMCSMDPGSNTVIYRMTSQRIKKDQ